MEEYNITDEEINYYLWSIIIDVFGDKISFDNFLII